MKVALVVALTDCLFAHSRGNSIAWACAVAEVVHCDDDEQALLASVTLQICNSAICLLSGRTADTLQSLLPPEQRSIPQHSHTSK